MTHGSATGQGFSFVLSSDIRVVSDDERFCAAYINIGLGGADMACTLVKIVACYFLNA